MGALAPPSFGKRSALLDENFEKVHLKLFIMRSDKYIIKNFRASGATFWNQRSNWQKGRAKNWQYEKRSTSYVKVCNFRIRTLPDLRHGTPLQDIAVNYSTLEINIVFLLFNAHIDF